MLLIMCLVEFKIYISLKPNNQQLIEILRLVEFKIYISLKLLTLNIHQCFVQQNSKFTYLSNKCRSKHCSSCVQQNSKFTYLSNRITLIEHFNLFSRIQNLHISQTIGIQHLLSLQFSRIQNLHISQTKHMRQVNLKLFSRIQNLHISQT